MKLLSTICFVLLALSTNAQVQMENLNTDIEKFNSALIAMDHQVYVQMTIPSVVEKGGGVDIMNDIQKETFATFASSGIKVESLTPLQPLDVRSIDDSEHLAIIPQEIILKVADRKFKKTAYFLGRSNDYGKSWTFLDLEPYNNTSIKAYIPIFPEDMTIPPATDALSEVK